MNSYLLNHQTGYKTVAVLHLCPNPLCNSSERYPCNSDIELYMEKMYAVIMKYEWNPEKNEWLKKEREISFEEVVFHLSQGEVWKVADHPGQKIYFVNIEEYIYLVPHILSEEHIFLKTIIPSRKATKDYQREHGGQ